MIRRPPRSTLTDTLFPYTTLFRSLRQQTRVREIAQDADATDTPAITGAQAGKRQFDRNLPAALPSQLDQRWNGVDVALVAQDLQDRLGQCGDRKSTRLNSSH